MKTYSIVLVTAILMMSCSSEKKKDTARTKENVLVRVQKVNSNTAQNTIRTNGIVQAKTSAKLSTRVMGYITNRLVEVGDQVVKGQLLVTINNNDLQAQKAQVEARIVKANTAFVNAEKDYQRFTRLYEQQSISQKEMDDMTARYELAKANLQAATQMKNEIESQFAYTNIKAPFTGKVTQVYANKGTMANPGAPLLDIESTNGFEVETSVPESTISSIEKGTKVQVQVKATQAMLEGVVKTISSSAIHSGGQYQVRVMLTSNSPSVLSGMYATVFFPNNSTSSTNGHVFIPKSAIVERGQLQGVYTISQSNTALLRWLRLGQSNSDDVEVLSGLTEGETIILSAEGKLYNGAPISIQ